VLGLGAGSAARLVRALAPAARIDGAEWSGDVLRAARRHIELDALGVQVVHADAREYLARARGSFDVVIEDLFEGSARNVHKPVWVLANGLAAAARRVRPGGILVANSIDETGAVARALSALFPAQVEIRIEGWDNRVRVAGPSVLQARDLRSAVAAHPVIAPALPRLSFRAPPQPSQAQA
jgi:spermidine synthase